MQHPRRVQRPHRVAAGWWGATLLCSLVCAMLLVTSASGEERREGTAPAAATLDTQLLRTGLYLISGDGANSLLRFSSDGLFVVDAKQPGSYRALMAQVRKVSKISDLPVRVLVLTGPSEPHTGNVAQFARASAVVVAQQNMKAALSAVELPAGKSLHLIAYERTMRVPMGGVELELLHFGQAHSNADTVVVFPHMKVAAVGEIYTPGTPSPDFARGGSLVGWSDVLAEVLKLDVDVLVPSTGTPVGKAELRAFKDRLDTVLARATALVHDGVPPAQLMARLRTDDLGWQLRFSDEQAASFHAELSRRR